MRNKKIIFLKKEKDFYNTYKYGKNFFSKNFIIKTNDSKNDFFRIGISVSKKHWKKAVIRNKIRRQIKNFCQKKNSCFIKLDYLIIVKYNYDTNCFHDNLNEFSKLLSKISKS